jgi:hypothetical protein
LSLPEEEKVRFCLAQTSFVVWRKMKVTNFLFTFLIRVHRARSWEGGETGESADVFSAFVSPHKLINILSFSLSRRPHPEHEDNNIKNYCLTFMCHLANIFSFFVAWLFSRFAFLRWVHSPKDRLKRASKELFYCFTFLSALMSFYCQSFACRNILHFVARRQSFALFFFLTHFSPPEAGAANSFRKRISACKSWESR